MRSGYPKWAPYFFIAPFVVVFMVFMAYPMIYSIVLSAQQTYGPQSRQFVFLDNFQYLINDPQFWKAMRNTTIFAAGSVFVQLPLSLLLALFLNRPHVRGRMAFRLVFFSPVLVGTVFVAIMFSIMLSKSGMVNAVLGETIPGFNPEFGWLENYVMGSLILAALWQYTGYNMVYFLAALQNVDKNLVEASMIDGANAWHRFWHVTFPAIRPVASFVVLLSLIGSFQLFELPWVLLNNGSGPADQGLTVVMYLYQNGFISGDLGYASAIGWALALVLMVFAFGQRWATRKLED